MALSERQMKFIMERYSYGGIRITSPLVRKYSEQVPWKLVLKNILLDASTGQKKFSVFCLEAGVGKSLGTNEVIIEYLRSTKGKGNKRFLIVKPFSNEVNDCANVINEVCPKSALAITTKEWIATYRESPRLIIPYNIIVITHSRYIDLCLDDYLRATFCEGREVLIIDEKINFPTCSFSQSIYKNVLNEFPPLLDEKLSKLCVPILSQLEILEMQYAETYEIEIDWELFSELKELVEICVNEGTLKRDIIGFFEKLEVLATNRAIFSGGNGYERQIRTFNPRHKLWGLENNVILDASGNLDNSYRNSNQFIIHEYPRLADYSNSKIHLLKCGSSYSSIYSNRKEYFKKMCGLFSERYQSDKKALIIVHEAYEAELREELLKSGFNSIGIGDDYNDELIAINHFGNIIGVNKYRDFNQCWVIGTFNLPMDVYALKWYQYSNNAVSDFMSYSSYCDRTSRKFDDPHLEQMRKSTLIGDIYQAVKRIQRNLLPHAEIFVAIKQEEIFEAVANELKGIKRGEIIELSFGNEKKKSERITATDKILMHIKVGMRKGEQLSKKEFRTHPSVDLSEKNLARNLRHPSVQHWRDIGLFDIVGNKIIKLKEDWEL
ncbi:DEAD/DEAH box helicase [Paenibacillus sp. Soil750]|uniref:DEAD/DEAH box helicase n=1 Tax=Paenibacillus sp. Soil750 TaxID=1736398 RepID=UPI0006F8D3D8|nr:DEAD/DEAH box helicase [Paenibacillus sp. Soil750]KRE70865.1 hypothetical protein ASL11_11265 [Paenibacillus sp. Soil750]